MKICSRSTFDFFQFGPVVDFEDSIEKAADFLQENVTDVLATR